MKVWTAEVTEVLIGMTGSLEEEEHRQSPVETPRYYMKLEKLNESSVMGGRQWEKQQLQKCVHTHTHSDWLEQNSVYVMKYQHILQEPLGFVITAYMRLFVLKRLTIKPRLNIPHWLHDKVLIGLLKAAMAYWLELSGCYLPVWSQTSGAWLKCPFITWGTRQNK